VFQAFFLLAGLLAQSEHHDGGETLSPDQEFQALISRYEEAYQAFVNRRRERLDPREFAGGFMRLARAHPGTKVAEESLVWVAAEVLYGSETEEAKWLLTRDHIDSTKLIRVFNLQWRTPGSVATERLLRQAFARSPHREVRGLAGYWLARFLRRQANLSRYARRNPNPPASDPSVIEEGWGADFLERLRRLDPDALEKEAEQFFSRVAEVYGDVPIEEKDSLHKTLGAAARAYLHENRQLSVGRPAPEIEGEDLDGVRFKLSDYRGKVVVLDFGSHFRCGACREMYPHERSLVKRKEGKPFVLLGINADNDRDALKAAMKEEGNTWRCWWDRDWGGPIQSAWNIRSYPTIYVIDASGIIRFKSESLYEALAGKTLDEVVDALLVKMGQDTGPEAGDSGR
jgi:thiol-disulfide isomerase/thioredoxin